MSLNNSSDDSSGNIAGTIRHVAHVAFVMLNEPYQTQYEVRDLLRQISRLKPHLPANKRNPLRLWLTKLESELREKLLAESGFAVPQRV